MVGSAFVLNFRYTFPHPAVSRTQPINIVYSIPPPQKKSHLHNMIHIIPGVCEMRQQHILQIVQLIRLHPYNNIIIQISVADPDCGLWASGSGTHCAF